MLLYLALRNFYLLKKRYALMIAAVAFGFALITVLTALSFGALETVKSKAARYYSGHVTVVGITGWSMGLGNSDDIIKFLSESSISARTISKRTIYYGKETRLFFGGKYARILRPIGVDFEKEKKEFEKISFVEGGITGIAGEENGIIISKATSKLLGARTGDDVILYLITTGGSYNIANMVVKGIFDESSMFGYAVYLRNQDLNKLLDKPPDSATEIAVYAKEGVSIARFAKKIYSELKKYYNVFPPILTRSEYSEQRSENKDKEIEKLAVVSVDAQLDQLKNILDAFLIGTYFVLIIFLFIVMAGIVNTYRVLIYERTREIGTMRAIGMQSYEVKLLFLGEAVLLAVVSCLTGFFAGFIILNILKLIVIGNNAVSAIFVENGKLNYFIGAKMFFLNIFFMLFAVVLAAWGTASKAGNMPPAEALRKE